MEHLPLRVVLNLTDTNFQSQAQILRNQVETAGGTFIEHKDLSPIQFLSKVHRIFWQALFLQHFRF